MEAEWSFFATKPTISVADTQWGKEHFNGSPGPKIMPSDHTAKLFSCIYYKNKG